MEINKYDKKALIELAKSIGRFLWFGCLGLLALALGQIVSSGQLNDVTITIGGMAINLGFIVVAAIGLMVKAIDQYIHKNKNIDSKGLAPGPLQS